MGQEHQRNVPVPTAPGPDLVLIEARLPVGLLEILLHRPASTRHRHQLLLGGASWGERQGVGQRGGIVDASPDQQPAGPAGMRMTGTLFPGPVVPAESLGASSGTQAVPGVIRQSRRQFGSPHLPGCLLLVPDPHRLMGADGQHIGLRTFLQLPA